MPKPARFMLVAGEPSGDALGAGLMAALKDSAPGAIEFSGVGGPLMAAEGLQSLFPMQDITVMGLAEVLPRLRLIMGHLRRTTDFAARTRPDVVVTIDSPGFNFRLARRLHPKGLRLVHYVAPTVWAWKPGRARRIAPLFEHLLALLPFEPPYFEVEGLACTFVGHPVAGIAAEPGAGAAFRARHGIGAEVPVVCVLPGSRHSEVSRLLPVFGDAVRELCRGRPPLRVVVPAVEAMAAEINRAAERWPGTPVVVTGDAEKLPAFAASDAAIAASGTVALELAVAQVPTVIAYRLHPLTWWLARRLVRVRYVNLVNLILDRPEIPELLQDACTAPNLARETARLLDDEAARKQQVAAAAEAVSALAPGGESPSVRAARILWDLLGKAKPNTP
ncbi:MAG TPA: lipid-A-disaccharide synthase [Alphaproteobacteria bacterium]|nr:lipid-A-disaccharide synthase [Alphaproteobacteria bacterium]